MKFSTEEFLYAVIKDVKKKYPVDKHRIFVLAWSSGGPVAYAATLQKETPITGAFIAMSVFKPEQLPSLQNAKGRLFYLLQSPQDFIPFRMVEQARDQLTSAGAIVKLETYEGGHGWQGDPYKMIQKGFEWLEEKNSINILKKN